MKKILIIFALLFSVIATAQQYHDKGAKFENATSVGDTISNNTRIPIIDEFGLVNYYVDVADLLALNPVPAIPNLQSVTNQGNTTNNKIIVTGTNGTIPQDGMYIASPGIGQGIVMNRNSSTQSSSSINFLPTTSQFQFNPVSQNATILTIREETPTDAGVWLNTRMEVLPAVNANDAVTLNQLENVTITESQITDFKDYLRGDINDTNGANKLTLGSLEVTGQTILQNGLNMTSVPVGTSDNILTLNQTTGDVEQRVFSLGNIDIANAAGVSQFSVGLDEQLRFQGLNDASVSFDAGTKTITVSATGGSSGEGGVDTFNGRDGAVTSQAGDYSTAMVDENVNLYFTEPRVRATPLTGLTVTNTPISSTNTFLQALGRLQGQINNGSSIYLRKDITDTKQGNLFMESGDLTVSRDGLAIVEITGIDNVGGVVGTDTDHDLFLRRNNAAIITLLSTGADVTGDLNVSGTSYVQGNPVWHSGNFTPSDYLPLSGGSMTGNIQLSLTSSSITNNTNDVILRNNGTSSVLSSQGSAVFLRPNGDNNSTGEFVINPSGNVTATGTITGSNLSGTNTGDQTLSGLGGVPTSRQINTGNHLSGGGNLSANRTLTVTPTVDQWILDSQGNQRMYFNSGSAGSNGIILKASAATQRLQYRDVNNNQVFTVDDSGNVTANGTVTASNFILSSDIRIKENIRPLGNGYYSFNFKDDKTKSKRYGVIAQEVEKYAPELVSEGDDGYKKVAYIDLLIKKIAELENRIKELEKK